MSRRAGAKTTRLVRVSDRGKWHVACRVIERTGAYETVCGRVLPKIEVAFLSEIPIRDQPADAKMCGKCI